MSDKDYGAAVDRAKEYIRAGDAFQIVPARTFSTPRAQRRSVRRVSRVARALAGAVHVLKARDAGERRRGPRGDRRMASPETLVRVQAGRITLAPHRGDEAAAARTQEEDERLAQEMLGDPKERAEHVMLIDLARNDVGRVLQSRAPSPFPIACSSSATAT